MIGNLTDLCKIADDYLLYLDGRISFTEDGFPCFEKEMFLEEEPELIIPFQHRNNKVVTNKKKTILCFYTCDSFLYCRLEKLLDEIDEYKKYQGVIGLDITITDDMDVEWQNFIMLINQLFLAVLACNNIKIVMNARIGSNDSINNLKGFPKNVMCATSFLGCEKLKTENDYSFISKVLFILPKKLLIYGKHDTIAETQLSKMGIDFRVYTDMHRLTKGVI